MACVWACNPDCCIVQVQKPCLSSSHVVPSLFLLRLLAQLQRRTFPFLLFSQTHLVLVYCCHSKSKNCTLLNNQLEIPQKCASLALIAVYCFHCVSDSLFTKFKLICIIPFVTLHTARSFVHNQYQMVPCLTLCICPLQNSHWGKFEINTIPVINRVLLFYYSRITF